MMSVGWIKPTWRRHAPHSPKVVGAKMKSKAGRAAPLTANGFVTYEQTVWNPYTRCLEGKE